MAHRKTRLALKADALNAESILDPPLQAYPEAVDAA